MEQLQQDGYRKYIDKVVDQFTLSRKDSSILFDLKINNEEAIMNMSVVGQDGEKEELFKASFKNDEKFYSDFVKQIVSDVYSKIKISIFDVVNLDNDEFFAFRMITEDYDLFVIDGLEKNKAYELLDGIKKDDSPKALIKGNDGTGNILFLFIMISVLVVSFISIVVFLG